MAMTSSSPSPWCMASLRSALPRPHSARLPSLRSTPPRSRPHSSRFPSLRFSPPATIPSPSQLSSGRGRSMPLRSFSSFAPMTSLNSIGIGFTNFENLFNISNGGKFYCMRHRKRVPKLNRPPDQRRALLRGLTTQLLKHGRIKTTKARARAMRKYVDKMITLAKDGSLHKRRQALAFIYEKQIVHALFAEVQDRYGNRNGGYTRIMRTLPRRGDNAPMAYIELV